MKEVMEAAPKLITGARGLWRVRQAKAVLLKDAVLKETISPTVKIYTKTGDIQRAALDFYQMHPYDIKAVKDLQSEKARAARIGKYTVRIDKNLSVCKASPCHSITMIKPSSEGARREEIIVMYTYKFDGIKLRIGSLTSP